MVKTSTKSAYERGDIVRVVSRVVLVFMILALFAVYGQIASAQEFDTLQVNETWDQNRLIESNLVIPPGITLTITAGVEVQFAGPYAIYVYGVIRAEGELADDHETVNWVTFTQNIEGLEDSLRWRGIRFDGGLAGSVLNYCIIENAYAHQMIQDPEFYNDGNGGGLYIYGSSPRLENCIIRNCKADLHGGGAYFWLSSSFLRNLLVVDNQSELEGGGLFMDMMHSELHSLTIIENWAGDGDNRGSGMYFGPETTPYIRSSILWHNGNMGANSTYDDIRIAGREQQDSFGANTIKFSITSQIPTNADQYLYKEDPDFSEGDEYRLEPWSRAVDGGAFQDDRWVLEDWENHSSGGRINMGVWGGTPRAQASVPVARAANSPLRYGYVRPADTAVVRLASIENIGHDLLTVYPDSVYFVLDSIDPDNDPVLPEDSLRFTVYDFDTIEIGPDSTKEFEIGYIIDPADYAEDDAYLHVHTSGGLVEFKLVGTPFDPELFIEEPHLIDFGEISLDTVSRDNPVIRSFTIENHGHTELTIGFGNQWMRMNTNNFEVPKPWLWTDTDPWYDDRYPNNTSFVDVLPGDTREVLVFYPPTQDDANYLNWARDTGEIDDVIRVVSDQDRFIDIEITATVFGAVMRTEEADTLVDFNYVIVNTQHTQYVTIFNDGNRELTIDRYAATHTDFSIDLPPEGLIVPPREGEERGSRQLGINLMPDDPANLETYDEYITVYATNGDSAVFHVIGRATQGGIYFSGDIPDADRRIPDVWGANEDEMVFVCAGPSTIPAGKKLVILEGVTVRFEGTDYIQVSGNLEVLGSESNPVRFEPENLDGDHYFGGLRFVAADPMSRMLWTEINYATAKDTTTENQLLPEAYGGGIAVYNCNPSFYHVTVRNSYSYNDGGGMWVYQSAPAIVRCTFEQNHAEGNGGGLSFRGSSPVFECNTIDSNYAEGGGGGLHFRYFADPIIANSKLFGNEAEDNGGALFIEDHSSPVILNSVLFDDSAHVAGNEIFVRTNSNPILRNSVVWGVPDDVVHTVTASRGTIVARYSDIQNLDLLTDLDHDETVFELDPLFDPASPYNFSPAADSPLIDSGDPGFLHNDASFPPSQNEELNDIGIYGGPRAAAWDGAPLKVNFLLNLASQRYFNVVINSIPEEMDGAPGLTIRSLMDTMEYVPTEIIEGVYQQRIEVDEPVYLEVIAHGLDINQSPVKYRRSISVDLYKPATGGILQGTGGMSLVLPPSEIGAEMVLLAEETIDATRPESAVQGPAHSSQWKISSSTVWYSAGEISLPYDQNMIPDSKARELSIWRKVDGEWIQLESQVNTRNHTVSALTDSDGMYTVFRTPGVTSELLPETTTLGSNYPNPFNPSTTIPFEMSQSGQIQLRVFNVLGQQVATIANGWYSAGVHEVIWNTSNEPGMTYSTGMYFYQLQTFPSDGTKGIVQTRKLVLMR